MGRPGTYITGKWKGKWVSYKAKKKWSDHSHVLEELDSSIVKRGFDIAYIEGLDHDEFEKNTVYLERVINIAIDHGTHVTFMIPPALFGE